MIQICIDIPVSLAPRHLHGKLISRSFILREEALSKVQVSRGTVRTFALEHVQHSQLAWAQEPNPKNDR